MRTHSSVLSSRTASVSGREKISMNTTATKSMRVYSLNYLSSSLKSLCSQILMLALFPADRQLFFPHPTAPHLRLVLPVPKVCAHFLLVPHSLNPSGFFLLPSHTLDFSTIFSAYIHLLAPPKSGYTLTPLRFGSSHFTQPMKIQAPSGFVCCPISPSSFTLLVIDPCLPS